jgi:hypothetical protein
MRVEWFYRNSISIRLPANSKQHTNTYLRKRGYAAYICITMNEWTHINDSKSSIVP